MKSVFHKSNLPIVMFGAGFVLLFLFFFFVASGKKTKQAKTQGVSRQNLISSSRDQELQKFNLTGYDDKGKTFWNLTGETAKIDPGQTVFLDQNVVLKLQGDTVVKTDHVQWSQDGGLLTTSAPVFVDHKNAKIKGLGAVGRPAESFIQLNRNIDMVIHPSIHLTCQGPMKIFYKEHKMTFYRYVRVEDERGVLKANRMDVLFDPVEKKIDQIIAIGNVTIERGTDITHSQRAIYSLVTGSVRLEGNPEITLHKESQLVDAPFRN